MYVFIFIYFGCRYLVCSMHGLHRVHLCSERSLLFLHTNNSHVRSAHHKFFCTNLCPLQMRSIGQIWHLQRVTNMRYFFLFYCLPSCLFFLLWVYLLLYTCILPARSWADIENVASIFLTRTTPSRHNLRSRARGGAVLGAGLAGPFHSLMIKQIDIYIYI